eukprot:SM000022S07287  [mRNA]  locus=s22:943323:944150:- [translate_table: standard]
MGAGAPADDRQPLLAGGAPAHHPTFPPPVEEAYGSYQHGQPPPPPQWRQGVSRRGEWTTGLLACCDDVPVCCLTYWAPCITFGLAADAIDGGRTTWPTAAALWYLLGALTQCACIYSCTYRTRLRHKFGLPEQPCGDACVHWLCMPCALCQEYRELKYRGHDPWHAAFDGGTHTVTYPPQQQRMA